MVGEDTRYHGAMPLYEYECRACEGRFERLTSHAQADCAECPRCGGGDVRRLLSVIGGLSGGAEPGGCGGCGGGCACGAHAN